MRLLVGVALAVASTVLHAQSLPVVDGFDDGNDDGWTRYNPFATFGAGATFSFPGGGYRIQAPESPFPTVLGPGRAGSARLDVVVADFSASVDLVGWDDSLEQGFGLLARLREPGLGTSDGYWLHYVTQSPVFVGMGSLVLDRIDNEVPFILGEVPISLDPARSYRLVFAGDGPSLSGQLFDIGNPSVPLITISATDATYTFGSAGILVSDLLTGANGPADATFDNFYVAAVPEPGAFTLFGAGLLGLVLRRRKQVSPAL